MKTSAKPPFRSIKTWISHLKSTSISSPRPRPRVGHRVGHRRLLLAAHDIRPAETNS
jgi:hypothetical protein